MLYVTLILLLLLLPILIQGNPNESTINTTDMPTRNIKIKVVTLEKELEEWKRKYARLEKHFDDSQRICRYIAIEFGKTGSSFDNLGKKIIFGLSDFIYNYEN
jgi:hypothetical protein